MIEPPSQRDLASRAGLLLDHDADRDLVRLSHPASIDAFLAAVAETGVVVLGFDGFAIEEEFRTPVGDANVDLSGCATAKESVDEARLILMDLRGRDLWFEFVFGDDPDSAQ